MIYSKVQFSNAPNNQGWKPYKHTCYFRDKENRPSVMISNYHFYVGNQQIKKNIFVWVISTTNNCNIRYNNDKCKSSSLKYFIIIFKYIRNVDINFKVDINTCTYKIYWRRFVSQKHKIDVYIYCGGNW